MLNAYCGYMLGNPDISLAKYVLCWGTATSIFIAKYLMVGLVKRLGIRYCPPVPRSVSKPPDLLEKSQS